MILFRSPCKVPFVLIHVYSYTCLKNTYCAYEFLSVCQEYVFSPPLAMKNDFAMNSNDAQSRLLHLIAYGLEVRITWNYWAHIKRLLCQSKIVLQ